MEVLEGWQLVDVVDVGKGGKAVEVEGVVVVGVVVVGDVVHGVREITMVTKSVASACVVKKMNEWW